MDFAPGVTDALAACRRYGLQLKARAHWFVARFDRRQREDKNTVAICRIGQVSSHLIRQRDLACIRARSPFIDNQIEMRFAGALLFTAQQNRIFHNRDVDFVGRKTRHWRSHGYAAIGAMNSDRKLLVNIFHPAYLESENSELQVL